MNKLDMKLVSASHLAGEIYLVRTISVTLPSMRFIYILRGWKGELVRIISVLSFFTIKTFSAYYSFYAITKCEWGGGGDDCA
jgi:hypothetical protein